MNNGLYPETLPPCFDSRDSERSFRGIVSDLDNGKFHERRTEYIRYSGTKHDGSRRFFGTPNIVSYFHISTFIWRKWKFIERKLNKSHYSIGRPVPLGHLDDRTIKVPSLSELSKHTSKNLKFSPYILKADISQCFPSIYTHSIAWAAHGISESKSDTNKNSKKNQFNALDFFVRNSQNGNTRGVLIGPDAYRIIAEFVLSKIDEELEKLVNNIIIGAVRHVDDYYIGLRTEYDAQSVLSHLREVLATYELNLNDQKTKIYSSLDPINDLWAQRLRDHTGRIFGFPSEVNDIERAISESVNTSKEVGSDSPMKILLRALDDSSIYISGNWDFVESNIQRIVQKHPHALDYACLIVAKRYARGHSIDKDGWRSVAEMIISRGLSLNHHHEVVWMLWLMIVCEIGISDQLLIALSKSNNGHIRVMLIQAFVDMKISRKPDIKFGAKLNTMDANWLLNLVGKSIGYTSAPFSGLYAGEFGHLASRNIKLIDFDDHISKLKKINSKAISRTRYGYEHDEDDDEDDYDGLSVLTEGF